MFCAHCGQQLQEIEQYCPRCGQPATSSSGVAPPPAWNAAAASASPAYARAIAAPANLQGINGWLLFFCICLTILWPMWTLSNYVLLFARTRYYPLATVFLRPLMLFAWVRLALGILAGIFLWSQNQLGMTLLRLYFGLGVLSLAISMYQWVPFFSRSHSALTMIPQFLFSFVPSFLFLGAGILYFSLSRGVRATYGTNLF